MKILKIKTAETLAAVERERERVTSLVEFEIRYKEAA